EGWEVELFIDGRWESITVSPEEITNDGAMQVRGDTRGDGEPGFMSVYKRALINAHEGRPSAISADTPAAGIEMITGRSTHTSSLGDQPSFRSEERRVGKEGGVGWAEDDDIGK